MSLTKRLRTPIIGGIVVVLAVGLISFRPSRLFGDEANDQTATEMKDIALTAPPNGAASFPQPAETTPQTTTTTTTTTISPPTTKMPRSSPAGAGTPVTTIPGGTFWDDDGNVHEPFIEAIAAVGITRGCSREDDDLYCPSREITRGEMAAFLVRALHLPASDTDWYVDDADSIFESDINALATAGVTRGCAPDRYCPDRQVSRAEMAALLVRAFGYAETPPENPFVDDEDSIFENDIERLAGAGVTAGCNPPRNDRFCPDEPVLRDQMASFLGRALEVQPVTVPPRPARTISFTGDTLIHSAVTEQAARYGNRSGTAYDFQPMFEPVQELIEDADLAICHLEVPLSGRSRGVSGYPTFSAPPELADALVWAGYDGCSTASNHSIDQGFAGLVETIKVMEKAGLGQAGMSATEAASGEITSYDVDGVTVAHLSATYGLNGLQLPSDAPWAVELIDLDRLLGQAEQAKHEGADFVVASIHCCIEYDHQPTSYQVEVHRTLIDSPDVDLVVGHHAHVIQPIEFRNDQYLVYGLGNFLSNMRQPATIDGVIVTVEIAKRGEVWASRDIRFTPTLVESGTFRILPAAESIAAGWPSASLVGQLASSWRRTVSIIGMFDAPGVTPTASP